MAPRTSFETVELNCYRTEQPTLTLYSSVREKKGEEERREGGRKGTGGWKDKWRDQ